MPTIHRYTLGIRTEQTVHTHAGARMLSTVADHSGAFGYAIPEGDAIPSIDVWAIVDTSAPRVQRMLYIVGTGGPVPEHAVRSHLGSVVMKIKGRRAVWHVFDGGEVIPG